ncbi:hypothetical protein [Nostoc sp. FACHB-888]|uniref:hypothetical protein n=1 Tax=Nostoc sp. FACHB-888 TaxID=2692842 RepID=UPI00168490E2|nr:hypothetical protein [Nostoc sp. FACHB-888]MBD2244359.1 hypothetical protein [Nostoc sp. FACHB-888]
MKAINAILLFLRLRARFPANKPLITPIAYTSAGLSVIKERIDWEGDGLPFAQESDALLQLKK